MLRGKFNGSEQDSFLLTAQQTAGVPAELRRFPLSLGPPGWHNRPRWKLYIAGTYAMTENCRAKDSAHLYAEPVPLPRGLGGCSWIDRQMSYPLHGDLPSCSSDYWNCPASQDTESGSLVPSAGTFRAHSGPPLPTGGITWAFWDINRGKGHHEISSNGFKTVVQVSWMSLGNKERWISGHDFFTPVKQGSLWMLSSQSHFLSPLIFCWCR